MTLIGSDGGYEITHGGTGGIDPVASTMSWPATSANGFPDGSGKMEKLWQPRIIFLKAE